MTECGKQLILKRINIHLNLFLSYCHRKYHVKQHFFSAKLILTQYVVKLCRLIVLHKIIPIRLLLHDCYKIDVISSEILSLSSWTLNRHVIIICTINIHVYNRFSNHHVSWNFIYNSLVFFPRMANRSYKNGATADTQTLEL